MSPDATEIGPRAPLWRLLGTWVPAAVLLWAGVAKAAAPQPAVLSLVALGFPQAVARGAVPLLVATEVFLAVLLVMLPGRRAAWLTVGLLALFTAYLFSIARLSEPPSCGCFGLMRMFYSARAEALAGAGRNMLLIAGMIWGMPAAARTV